MLDDASTLSMLHHVDRAVLFTIKEESVPVSPLRSAIHHVSLLSASGMDGDRLNAIMHSFNRGALVQMQCGSMRGARSLCEAAIGYYWKEFERTGQPAWIVGAIQPLINLARLSLTQDGSTEAMQMMCDIYAFARYGTEFYVDGRLYDGRIRSTIEATAPNMLQVAVNAYVVDTVKAHLSAEQPTLLAGHIDHLFAEGLQHSPVGRVLHESDVRNDLMSAQLSRAHAAASYLWWTVRSTHKADPVVLSLLLDTLHFQRNLSEARSVLETMIAEAAFRRTDSSVAQQQRLTYSLALRSLRCDLEVCAKAHLEQAETLAASQNDERMLCRLMMLRYVLAVRCPELGLSLEQAVAELTKTANNCMYAREKAMARYFLDASTFEKPAWNGFLRETTEHHYKWVINTRNEGRDSVSAGKVHAAAENPISELYRRLLEVGAA